ncbi:MAG: hypothetical protein ABJC10_01130 [Acidobacteriota bacterium]
MYYKVALICLLLVAGLTASQPKVTQTPKPRAARFLVQGTYEETYQGTTNKGRAEGKLLIKFEAARWLALTTNEVGNAEFSDLANAPTPSVSGSVSYDGRVKGASGGDSYEATSYFDGALSGNDVVLSVPYDEAGAGFKLKISINPKLKGKCSLVEVRNGETGTASGCENGTYFFTATNPLQIDDNDDPARTPDTASFGLELDIEPEPGAGRSPTMGGDAGVYAWRGAVATGSKEAGFKITLSKTKELSSDDQRGHTTRKLAFNATIVPGAPAAGKQ